MNHRSRKLLARLVTICLDFTEHCTTPVDGPPTGTQHPLIGVHQVGADMVEIEKHPVRTGSSWTVSVSTTFEDVCYLVECDYGIGHGSENYLEFSLTISHITGGRSDRVEFSLTQDALITQKVKLGPLSQWALPNKNVVKFLFIGLLRCPRIPYHRRARLDLRRSQVNPNRWCCIGIDYRGGERDLPDNAHLWL
ncbi:hypothetical protein MD484_g8942, partial [Candolleomyces efflorescens]